MSRALRIGTRGSALALRQTQVVVELLRTAQPDLRIEIITIRTTGDKVLDIPLAQIGEKGLFVKEIEEALLDGSIDWAVHSVKDLPSQLAAGLQVRILAVREDPSDVLVARHGLTLTTLPSKATIGTSSLRRRAQLLHWRPDLEIVPMRGNVDTRLRKLASEGLDGIVLAAAGLQRLGWHDRITDIIPPDICLPAVGQGALGVEMRNDDESAQTLFEPLTTPSTQAAVVAERSFLARLEGGCQVPIAALAKVDGDSIVLRGMISAVDGQPLLRGEHRGALDAPERLGIELAEQLLQRGATDILQQVSTTARLAREVNRP
jgi:hydroxymethylbilane synthase